MAQNSNELYTVLPNVKRAHNSKKNIEEAENLKSKQ